MRLLRNPASGNATRRNLTPLGRRGGRGMGVKDDLCISAMGNKEDGGNTTANIHTGLTVCHVGFSRLYRY